MAGLTLDMAAALQAVRDLGATGWAATELLLSIRIGMAEGGAARRETTESSPRQPVGADPRINGT